MDVAIVTILSGISYGVVLFLIASGLSFVLGLMGIVNIAHGALVMAGAYLGLTVARSTGSLLLGGLCGALLAGILGLLIERGFLRKLYKSQLEQILVTFGFVYIITNIHLWVYGAWPKAAFVPASLNGGVTIGEYSFPYMRIIIIVIGIVLFPILWWLQERTKIGAIIRAGMDDPAMISAMGINLRPVNIGTFVIGACIAGFAGVVGASPLGGVNLNLGMNVIFIAIAVVVIGGMGSIQGTLVGALLIGVTQSLVGTYFSRFAIFIPYVIMIIILLFRPHGLFGKK